MALTSGSASRSARSSGVRRMTRGCGLWRARLAPGRGGAAGGRVRCEAVPPATVGVAAGGMHGVSPSASGGRPRSYAVCWPRSTSSRHRGVTPSSRSARSAVAMMLVPFGVADDREAGFDADESAQDAAATEAMLVAPAAPVTSRASEQPSSRGNRGNRARSGGPARGAAAGEGGWRLRRLLREQFGQRKPGRSSQTFPTAGGRRRRLLRRSEVVMAGRRVDGAAGCDSGARRGEGRKGGPLRPNPALPRRTEERENRRRFPPAVHRGVRSAHGC